MAEPVTAIDPDDENTQSLPKNAEDRKAAAALSSLNENEISQASGEAKPASQADQEALGKAMNRLEIASGQKKQVKKTEDATKEEVKKKPPVKVAADDVTLLVEELELTKVKATELLKAHEGDAVKAMRAFIAPTKA